MSKALRLVVCVLGCLVLTFAADGSSTAQPAGCALINVQDMRFGQYETRTIQPLDSVATLIYRCPAAGQVRIELSRGASGSFRRSMRVRDSVMQYNLYLDANHSRVWGDGSNGTAVYTGRPGNGAERVSIFGRVPPGQKLRAGEYTDQLVLTLLY
jgi:spore coat protein U-like protein